MLQIRPAFPKVVFLTINGSRGRDVSVSTRIGMGYVIGSHGLMSRFRFLGQEEKEEVILT